MPMLSFWPDLNSNEFIEENEQPIEVHISLIPQMATYIRELAKDEKMNMNSMLSILQKVRMKFGRKMGGHPDEDEVQINEEIIHQDYNGRNIEAIWHVVEDFVFPSTFASTLQRKYMCDYETAKLWIEEYRKFMTLMAVTNAKMYPSVKVE